MPFAQPGLLRGFRAALVYGAGNVGKDVAGLLDSEGVEVAAFLDRRPVPSPVPGTPVFHPDDASIPRALLELPVVLGFFNRDARVPDVERVLAARGFGPCIPFVDFHAAFPERLGDRFWLTRREVVEAGQEEIDRLALRLGDDLSRETLRAIVSLRLGERGAFDRLDATLATQYAPPDIPAFARRLPERFVDGGAFDGDTVLGLFGEGAHAARPLEHAVLFEPEEANFQALIARVRSMPVELRRRVSLWPCALSHRTGFLSFEGSGESGRAEDGGGTIVRAVALDDVLPGFAPTFVKLDLEGGEAAALAGMAGSFEDPSLKLAVSVYHKPADLWTLPALIARMLPRHELFLRAHGAEGFDVVLYAAPPASSSSPVAMFS